MRFAGEKSSNFISNIRAVFQLSEEMLTSVKVEETGRGIRCSRDEEYGKKVLSDGKTLGIKDFFVVGRGREMDKLDVSKKRKVEGCRRRVYLRRSLRWNLGAVDGWHSYKQLLLRQR